MWAIMESVCGTYFAVFSNVVTFMGWDDDMFKGNRNYCIVCSTTITHHLQPFFCFVHYLDNCLSKFFYRLCRLCFVCFIVKRMQINCRERDQSLVCGMIGTCSSRVLCDSVSDLGCPVQKNER